MSDEWIDRSIRDVFGETIGNELSDSKNYKRVLVNVHPDGRITYNLVNSDGYKIRGIGGTFRP